MTYDELIRTAQESGFTIEPTQRKGGLWVVGNGNLQVETLERFAAIISRRCAAIARQMNCPSVAGAIERDGK